GAGVPSDGEVSSDRTTASITSGAQQVERRNEITAEPQAASERPSAAEASPADSIVEVASEETSSPGASPAQAIFAGTAGTEAGSSNLSKKGYGEAEAMPS